MRPAIDRAVAAADGRMTLGFAVAPATAVMRPGGAGAASHAAAWDIAQVATHRTADLGPAAPRLARGAVSGDPTPASPHPPSMRPAEAARHDSSRRRLASSRILPLVISFVLTGPVAAFAQAQSTPAAAPQSTPAAADQSGSAAPAASQTSAPAAPDKAPTGFWDRDTLTGDWGGLRTTLQDAGIKFGLQEQSEVWGNLTGGVKTGAVYDGLTTGSVTLDLGKLVGWTGATFFVDAFQIHGRGPSGNLVGNLQLVSNIEATRDTKLYDLWLEQQLLNGRLTIRLGQEGANDQMMITQYGALFLNSSFGFPGIPAAVLPSGGPNYPMATPFVRVQFQPVNQITLVGAVFNGDPAPEGTGDPQARDKGGTAFRLNAHALTFGEIWFSRNQGDGAPGLPATYKLGFWWDSAHFPYQDQDTTGRSLASPASNGIPRSHSGDLALYGIVDQMVWRKPGTKQQGVGVFLQVMGAPGEYNLSNLFVEGGMNWMGPFEGRDSDVFGLAVTYLGISPAKRRFGNDVVAFTGTGFPYAGNETVVEATYVYQAAPWLAVQPDLQVVINPGAGIPSAFSPTPLKSDVITGVRATIIF